MTFEQFWPFYLGEHRNPTNRALHFIGTTGGLACGVLAIAQRQPWLVLAGLLSAYAFAWVGHFVIEKNRPATFKHPFYSFAGDWKMWWYMLTGRLGAELRALRIG